MQIWNIILNVEPKNSKGKFLVKYWVLLPKHYLKEKWLTVESHKFEVLATGGFVELSIVQIMGK